MFFAIFYCFIAFDAFSPAFKWPTSVGNYTKRD